MPSPDVWDRPVNPDIIRPTEQDQYFLGGKSPEQIADAIKDTAKYIRESSNKVRQFVITMRESGAIYEITDAIKEATIAARDTTQEIGYVVKNIRERDVIKDTANAALETKEGTRETIRTLKEQLRINGYSEPTPSNTVKKTRAKEKSVQFTSL